MLAVAGAGLFAVAAIVFTFFNPEIDYAARTTIIAIVTALFLGGAWFFASRDLRFSAEAVGALGMVFLALDVWAFADAAPPGVNGWAFAGIGTLVASSLMIAVAALVRLRVWLWLSIVGLSLAAAFFGYATENWWGATVGHLAAAFVALGAHELAKRLGARFDSALVADRVTATIVQFVAAFLVIVAIASGRLPLADGGVMAWTFGVAGLLAGLALLAALSTRNEAAAAWSVLAGAFAVAAIGILPHAFEVQPWEWEFALIPLAAAVAFFAISVASTNRLGSSGAAAPRSAVARPGGRRPSGGHRHRTRRSRFAEQRRLALQRVVLDGQPRTVDRRDHRRRRHGGGRLGRLAIRLGFPGDEVRRPGALARRARPRVGRALARPHPRMAGDDGARPLAAAQCRPDLRAALPVTRAPCSECPSSSPRSLRC